MAATIFCPLPGDQESKAACLTHPTTSDWISCCCSVGKTKTRRKTSAWKETPALVHNPFSLHAETARRVYPFPLPAHENMWSSSVYCVAGERMLHYPSHGHLDGAVVSYEGRRALTGAKTVADAVALPRIGRGALRAGHVGGDVRVAVLMGPAGLRAHGANGVPCQCTVSTNRSVSCNRTQPAIDPRSTTKCLLFFCRSLP